MKRIVNALLVLCAGSALPAQTFTTLHSFDQSDGASPSGGLVQAANGDFYGTTEDGGAWRIGGTVFKITPYATLTTLYSFCAQGVCADGGFPTAGLVQDTNGYFYGATTLGGANDDGTIFKISPSGTLTTLYSFCAQTGCGDGANPNAALVQATNGDFYGTTYGGGAHGYGTIFKMTRPGMLTTLYNFCPEYPCPDGGYPYAVLVQATSGDLYGTTQSGGAAGGGGTVFKITPSGTLRTLYSFCSQPNCTDGVQPMGRLVQAANGDLYGTTAAGGIFQGTSYGGTVFRVTPNGTLTRLYSFCAQTGCADGQFPDAGLIQATDGDFYGTTKYGGANGVVYGGYGTVFKITSSGRLTNLHSFCGQSRCPDGVNPTAGLLQTTSGDFYGTASGGGTGSGTIFSLSVGLGPFVETQRTSGTVGEVVEILGTDLAGATSVSFNGTVAVFDVVSSSLIATKVPAGASTGKVEVVTPRGTLSSNVPFRVVP